MLTTDVARWLCRQQSLLIQNIFFQAVWFLVILPP
jgi:hypothetical protein